MNQDQLITVFSQTLSPDAATRQNAERTLTEARKVEGHPLQVLQIVASSDQGNQTIRQAAAVHFKNIVKKGWDSENADETDGIVISPHDRQLIKSHLVELMCTVPPQIQAQCSEAISLIAAVDFPQNWDNLLPDLIQKFASPDPHIVCGVLETANSIFKRFRFVHRNDTLYTDLLYVLEKIQEPLLILVKALGQAVDSLQNDAAQLKPRMAALRTVCRIFFSLNWQDLPEYFEDHMGEWMKEFAKYLSYTNPLLTDADEELEASPIDKLQTAIVDNLFIYADKDEEPFIPFLPNFTTLVWNLLLGVTQFPKHDALATTAIKFLASLVGKQMHKGLFQKEETLREIVAKIVIPNLMIREVDEERFEDDPAEFIIGDMEESDTESRRKRSQELLRAMCRQFDAETTAICMQHIDSMLKEFQSAPNDKWIAKDAAIHLMLGISIKAESSMGGVTGINEKVNVMDFFSTHILTELQDMNHAARPMVKATSIKFASTFRNQFTKENLSALMPILISHLGSPSVVVHTYSAAAIEKFLTCKEPTADGKRKNKFGGDEIKPFLENLFTGLFAIVDNTDWNENEYVMKCIMRSLNAAKNDIQQPVAEIVLNKLHAALFVVAKNPRNPQYNHYMFESIAVLVKAVCSKHPEYTPTFETNLFPPFQQVLQMDVAEFHPYVFQILAQLLEYRPDSAGLGDAYKMLFPPMLTPTLWISKGNVPALTRLLQAYLKKGALEILPHLEGILGVFQKTLSSRHSEGDAFALLTSIIQFVPEEDLRRFFSDIFRLLFARLQNLLQLKSSHQVRYKRLISCFIALLIGKYGSQRTFELLNNVQAGMHIMFIKQIWMQTLSDDNPVRTEAKIQVIGLTKLICESPALLNDDAGREIWALALKCMMKILSSPSTSFSSGTDDDQEVEIGYDPTFSRLFFATRAPLDPFPEVKDPGLAFVQSCHQACTANEAIRTILYQVKQADSKMSVAVDAMFQKAGLPL